MSPWSKTETSTPSRPRIRPTISPTGPPPATMIRPFFAIRGRAPLGGDLFVFWLHFLDGAAPARMGEVENNSVRILVFHLVEGIRVVILPAHKGGAARLLDLLGGLVEIVDPHAEVDEPVVGLTGRHPGDVAGKLQQGDVHRTVAHIEADTGLAGAFHPKRLLEKLSRLFRIRNRNCDVTRTSNHVNHLW